MSKTPPLVIPVVIDGRGVDRGLNNINSRLRRGVGGGGNGVGTDLGTFGSGGVAAGAMAGAIAGGLRSGGGRYSASERDSYYKQPFQPQHRPGFGQGGGGRFRSFHESLIADSLSDPNNRSAQVKRQQAEEDFNEARRQNLRSSRLAHAKGQLRNFDNQKKLWPTISRNIDKAASPFIPQSRMLPLGLVGLAAWLGKKAIDLPKDIKAMNLDNIAGSQKWGVLRNMQLREQAIPNKNMNEFQSFLYGAQSIAGGGRDTSTQGFGRAAEGLWSSFWQLQGARFEYGLRAIGDVKNTILGRQLSN